MIAPAFRYLVSAFFISLLLCTEVQARLPPPTRTMDRLLDQAEVIVVAHVKPGSVRVVKGADGKNSFHELTLVTVKVLKGKPATKEITVTLGTFPAREFPKSKEHPQGRFLLTGWSEWGHTSEEARGLDLYAEQVWFLERFADFRLRLPKRAPLGVGNLGSVQERKWAPLIDLFIKKADVPTIRKLIDKSYAGNIPIMAVEAMYGSSDRRAGAFAWEYMQHMIEAEKAWGKMSFDQKKNAQAGDRPYLYAGTPFRTINSLAREEVLIWCRKSLAADDVRIRGFALEGIKRWADRDSLPELLKLLKSANSREIHDNIIETLGILGDTRAVPVLLDWLEKGSWRSARRALFRITDVRLSPNGNIARAWWQRNQNKPRRQWLNQGVEQDLHVLIKWAPGDDHELNPRFHLTDATCWYHVQSGVQMEDRKLAEAWKRWWQANKDYPQEKWVSDSFRLVGHPLPDLAGPEAVEALLKILNTEPEGWWQKGPKLDASLHLNWCRRLITRMTGMKVVETEYAFFTKSSHVEWKTEGPRWRALWDKNRHQIKVKPILIPEKQRFVFEDADRKLLCDDFDALDTEVVFQGPLVRKQLPGLLGKSILGTFIITVTNRSKQALTLHTRPTLTGEIGNHGFGSSMNIEEFTCITSKEEFATLRPGETLRWKHVARMHRAGDDGKTWLQHNLRFDERAPIASAWRGTVAAPWIAVKNEKIVDRADEGGK